MSITLYADLSSKDEGYSKFTLNLGLYPDNTPVVNLEKAWGYSGGKFKAILVRPNSMQEFFTAMMIVDSIRERGGYVHDLILPCIPGQRQDRMKWEGDWLLTLKFVAKTINGMNFQKVIALDPHSLAAGMIDRLHVPELKLENMLHNHKRGFYDGIIAPDAGAAARAGRVAEAMKIPLYQATKHRDPATNKLSGFNVPLLLSGKHYLVVDDLCDAGGTFMGLAEGIADKGATADLYVTHGLFSKGAVDKLRKVYNKIYTTDSIDAKHSGVEYIFNTEGLVK